MRARPHLAKLAPFAEVAGALIALAGFAYLFFTQLSLSDDSEFQTQLPERWDNAALALTVIALGLFVVLAAQVTRVFFSRDPESR